MRFYGLKIFWIFENSWVWRFFFRIFVSPLRSFLFSCDGEKVERCREMGISVVTYQWLVEIYLGIKNVVNENENYGPVPGMISDTNTTPYNMEHYSEACKQLLG